MSRGAEDGARPGMEDISAQVREEAFRVFDPLNRSEARLGLGVVVGWQTLKSSNIFPLSTINKFVAVEKIEVAVGKALIFPKCSATAL
ncbi:MAG: hypothetical protein QM706_13065 [Nitrospira sp.]